MIHCDVWISPARSGGHSVRPWSGHHRRNRQYEYTGDRLPQKSNHAERDTRGVEAGGPVHGTCEHSIEGVWASGWDHPATEGDYGPQVPTIPPLPVQQYPYREPDMDCTSWAEQSLVEACSSRNGRGTTGKVGINDPGCPAIWRRSPRIEDAFSKCTDVGCLGGSGCSPGSRRQRAESSQLPRHCRVRSKTVERLECSTPDGDKTQACQLSQRTVEDEICIYSPEGCSLRPHPATCAGQRQNMTGRPCILFTTPGSGFWGPWPSSHRWMEYAGDYITDPQVPSLLCWVSSCCSWHWFESLSPAECCSDDAVWGNEGFFHV